MRFSGLPIIVTALFMAAPYPVLAARGDDADICYRASGDVAIAACDRAIRNRATPANVRSISYYNRGIEYERKSEHDRAIADFTSALRINPKYGDAFHHRALMYRAKGELDRAIADFTSALQNKTGKPAAAYYARGLAYKEKGDLDRAVTDLGAALRIDASAVVYVDRGLIYKAKGELDRAIADYGEAIRLDSSLTSAYNNRAYAYESKGDFDRAIADCDAALRLDPNYVNAHTNRGNNYLDKSDYARAIADYDEAIRLNPKSAFAYFKRGLANIYAGMLAKALADLTQASDLDPKDAYAALWLDIAGQRSNVPSRLAQAVPSLDMTAWPAPVVHLFLGEMPPDAVLAAAEDPDASRRKSRLCEAQFYGGAWALRQGRRDEATRLFKLAASACPYSYYEWAAAQAELRPPETPTPAPPPGKPTPSTSEKTVTTPQ